MSLILVRSHHTFLLPLPLVPSTTITIINLHHSEYSRRQRGTCARAQPWRASGERGHVGHSLRC